MGSARVNLIPMTETDFDRFKERVVRDYAEESVAAGRVEEPSAFDWAREQTDKLLPDGINTKDTLLYGIVPEERPDVSLGTIWCAKDSNHGANAFVYDLFLEPDHRGQGYGTAAMEKLFSVLRDHGFKAVGLHVYTHNQAAMSLYEKVGFKATGMNLCREL